MLLIDKNVPPYVIRLRSALQSERLYKKLKLLEGTQKPIPTVSRPLQNAARSGRMEPTTIRTSIKTESSRLAERSKKARRLCHIWLNLPHLFYTAAALCAIAGITSGSGRSSIEKELIRLNLAVIHRLPRKKAFLVVWEPLPQLFQLTSIPVPSWQTIGGGFLHACGMHHLSAWAVSNGYRVNREFRLSSGRTPDLLFHHQTRDEWVFVEVAVSGSARREVEGIVRDFATVLQPEKVMVVAKSRKLRNAIRELVMNTPDLDQFRSRVSVELIGDFVQKEV